MEDDITTIRQRRCDEIKEDAFCGEWIPKNFYGHPLREEIQNQTFKCCISKDWWEEKQKESAACSFVSQTSKTSDLEKLKNWKRKNGFQTPAPPPPVPYSNLLPRYPRIEEEEDPDVLMAEDERRSRPRQKDNDGRKRSAYEPKD